MSYAPLYPNGQQGKRSDLGPRRNSVKVGVSRDSISHAGAVLGNPDLVAKGMFPGRRTG